MTFCRKRSISNFAIILCLSNDILLCDFVTAGESGFVAPLGMVQHGAAAGICESHYRTASHAAPRSEVESRADMISFQCLPPRSKHWVFASENQETNANRPELVA